jgi:hypothetical protein
MGYIIPGFVLLQAILHEPEAISLPVAVPNHEEKMQPSIYSKQVLWSNNLYVN